MSKTYSLFIGATEVTDELLTLEQCENLAYQYLCDGYDNTEINIVEYILEEQKD